MLSMKDLARSLSVSCEPKGFGSELSAAWASKGAPKAGESVFRDPSPAPQADLSLTNG